MTAVRRAADWAGRSEPLSTEMADPGHEPGPDDSEDILVEAVRAGIISTGEAELFRATHGTIGTVRARMGVTTYGAQNRRRRARQRLLDWLGDPL
jgi:hypothetical protein